MVIILSILVLVFVHQTDNEDLVEKVLIAVALLAYCLSIIGSIAVGLENLCILWFYALTLSVIFIGSSTFLVINTLDGLLRDEHQLITFKRSLLMAVIGVSSIQVLAAYYLIYEIIMERRIDRYNHYRLTTVLNIDELWLKKHVFSQLFKCFEHNLWMI